MEKQRNGLEPRMRMRSAQGTISDIKMVVHQQYEWIIEREVLERDNWRCQVPRPYKSRGQLRNVLNAANRRWYNILTSHQELLIQLARGRFGAGKQAITP